VRLIEIINRLFPEAPNIRYIGAAKQDRATFQQWEYDEMSRLLPEFGKYWNLQGKFVLDIGSGLGGKPLFFAESGAKCVFGIDLRPYSNKAALDLAHQHHFSQIHLIEGNAENLPFNNNSFDVIISINVFEHIENLFEALSECKRVLHEKGVILLHFPPFYSPWGAHLEGWINFPWPHLIFSDITLLQAAAQIDSRTQRNDQYIPTAQFKWAELSKLPELNRITAAQFFRLIRQVDLRILEAQMLPFGRHYFLNHGQIGRFAIMILKHLSQLPILREVITTKMLFILSKE
jgi:ubiquinone/menaquinone biosynthesis C-methylase UbiE